MSPWWPSLGQLFWCIIFKSKSLTLIWKSGTHRFHINMPDLQISYRDFAWLVPSHYLNQCCNIVNWTLGNKPQWNFNQNTTLFIHENAIDQFHKSQNAPAPYPAMLDSEQRYAYFCSEWSIVGYGTDAFWDLCIMSIEIVVCEMASISFWPQWVNG